MGQPTEGESMSQQQNGAAPRKQARGGRIVVIGAIATGLALFNLFAGGEADSPAVMLLQYAFLAAGLIALAGGFVVMASEK
jgi:hypothetical protein